MKSCGDPNAVKNGEGAVAEVEDGESTGGLFEKLDVTSALVQVPDDRFSDAADRTGEGARAKESFGSFVESSRPSA